VIKDAFTVRLVDVRVSGITYHIVLTSQQHYFSTVFKLWRETAFGWFNVVNRAQAGLLY
jgi:hypothetical protein